MKNHRNCIKQRGGNDDSDTVPKSAERGKVAAAGHQETDGCQYVAGRTRGTGCTDMAVLSIPGKTDLLFERNSVCPSENIWVLAVL